MSPAAPSPPEILHARKIAWRNRLWVRVSLMLFVLCGILWAGWWWPRRGIVAVWWAGGTATCGAEYQRATAVLDWLYPTGSTTAAQDRVHAFFSSFRLDHEITAVNLTDAPVDDRWLTHLQRFPKLKMLELHDRQLGPGLENLRDHRQLQDVAVTSASNRRLVELKRLPQLESLSLVRPQSGDLGLGELHLKQLDISETRRAGEVLAQIPDNSPIDSLVLLCCGLQHEDCALLERMPRLNYLCIAKSGPINDSGLTHLSRLSRLEELCLNWSIGQITEAGLQELRTLENLQHVSAIRTDLTPQQLQTLKQALPKATIRMH
jgi:hypothetical protein